ncbi:hypothetical protein [Brevundimonas sp.]
MSTGRPGKSLLEDRVWIELLERYVAGETASALALEYKVSVWTIAWQARNRGYRKMDRPGAVYRWHQAPPITPAPDPVDARGFDFDPDDLDGSAARALEKAAAAAKDGRLPDFLALTQSVRATRRLRLGVERGHADPTLPPAAAVPPHEGEGECSRWPIRCCGRRRGRRPVARMGGTGRRGCSWAGAGPARRWRGRCGCRTWPKRWGRLCPGVAGGWR